MSRSFVVTRSVVKKTRLIFGTWRLLVASRGRRITLARCLVLPLNQRPQTDRVWGTSLRAHVLAAQLPLVLAEHVFPRGHLLDPYC